MEKEKHFSFFDDVFRKIHRLTKLHLLVCPESPIHYEESIASPTDFKKLKRLYELLSGGNRFLRSSQIRNLQLYETAERHLNNPGDSEILFPIEDVTNGKINTWRNWYQISLNRGKIEGYEEALSDLKRQKYDGFVEVWERWKREKDRSFDDWYCEERMALCKVLKDKLTQLFERKLEIEFKHTQPLLGDMLPDDNEVLLMDLRRILGRDEPDLAEFKKVWRFLESDALDRVLHVRISSLMYAALAGRAGRLQKLPARAPFNDIDILSAYLPYCDAMFLDKEMEILLNEGPLRKLLGCNTRIFLIAKKDDFLAYLDSIETNASRGHLEKVREVYGDNWEDPFVELYHSLDGHPEK